MRSATSAVVCVLVGLSVFLSVYGEQCGTLLCDSEGGEMCCLDKNQGHRCYNTSYFSCLNTTGGNILCGYINGNWYPAQACGDICIDGSFYTCCNDKPYDKYDLGANPCLSPPRSDEAGCSPACVGASKCCNSTLTGPVCYSPSTHACVNDRILCAVVDGVPNLACGNTCYSANAYSCCNNALYAHEDLNNPCKTNLGAANLSPNWESEVFFTSNGFQAPPYGEVSRCNWNALDGDAADAYELHNCSSITGSGNFKFDENYLLMSFGLPMNVNSYSEATLSLYVDNSQGKTQPLGINVFDMMLQDGFNSSGSAAVRSCTSFRVFDPSLSSTNITVAEGFVGYVHIDVTPLLTWFLSTGNNLSDLQLSVSALNVCLCLESSGRCLVTLTCDCSLPSYHIKVNGASSANPPQLQLN